MKFFCEFPWKTKGYETTVTLTNSKSKLGETTVKFPFIYSNFDNYFLFTQFSLFFAVLTKNLKKLAFLAVLWIFSRKRALSSFKSHTNCFNEPQNNWCGLTKSNNVKSLVKKNRKTKMLYFWAQNVSGDNKRTNKTIFFVFLEIEKFQFKHSLCLYSTVDWTWKSF